MPPVSDRSGPTGRARGLKAYGMRAAFDEIFANGLKRQHSIPQIIGDLLQAEIADRKRKLAFQNRA